MPSGVYIRKNPMSDEQKNKISISKKGKHNFKLMGRKISKETKKKISVANKGKKRTPEMIEKYKVSNKDKNLGRHHSEKTKIKIGLSGIGLHVGALSGQWKGGISKIDKLCRRMMEYKQWRSDVFTRDNWTCQTCGKNGCYVTAHHIYGFSKILREENIKNILEAHQCKELWAVNNGVTLCEECHSLTDNYKGRAVKKSEHTL